MDQDELMQDLALKLDLANMELQTIDEVLARRPALARFKHRTEKIEHACRMNGDLLAALEHMVAVANWSTTIQSEEQFGQMIATAESAIRKAKGE